MFQLAVKYNELHADKLYIIQSLDYIIWIRDRIVMMMLKNDFNYAYFLHIIIIVIIYISVPSLARNSGSRNLFREKRQSGHDDA